MRHSRQFCRAWAAGLWCAIRWKSMVGDVHAISAHKQSSHKIDCARVQQLSSACGPLVHSSQPRYQFAHQILPALQPTDTTKNAQLTAQQGHSQDSA